MRSRKNPVKVNKSTHEKGLRENNTKKRFLTVKPIRFRGGSAPSLEMSKSTKQLNFSTDFFFNEDKYERVRFLVNPLPTPTEDVREQHELGEEAPPPPGSTPEAPLPPPPPSQGSTLQPPPSPEITPQPPAPLGSTLQNPQESTQEPLQGSTQQNPQGSTQQNPQGSTQEPLQGSTQPKGGPDTKREGEGAPKPLGTKTGKPKAAAALGKGVMVKPPFSGKTR